MVTVPQTYMGCLCGFCGNHNGQCNDDFQLSSGQLAPDATAFGSTWKTTDTPCDNTCPKDECPTCTEEEVAILQKPSYCGLLTAPEGPFGSCHCIIDPIPYSQSCIHDHCMREGDTHVLCQSIQSYVTACQALTCPTKSHYQLCACTCEHTCAGVSAPPPCSERCCEGCQCAEGLLFHGAAASSQTCGCLHQGRYFQLLREIRDVGDQLAVVALHLSTLHGLITMRKNRKVWLNRVPSPCPRSSRDR
ncbi:alpha-tectorin-like [Agelaius phoeniceus]|uniref:alpha-tectorin-like n=1 Tax=Agelaius phoeniceus TaxID=39638 RepID=UPI0040551DA1